MSMRKKITMASLLLVLFVVMIIPVQVDAGERKKGTLDLSAPKPDCACPVLIASCICNLPDPE